MLNLEDYRTILAESPKGLELVNAYEKLADKYDSQCHELYNARLRLGLYSEGGGLSWPKASDLQDYMECKEGEKRRSRRRWSFKVPGGPEVSKYVLYSERGEWLGDVMTEYTQERHELIMSTVSDFGDYTYRWSGAGKDGSAAFLLGTSNEYITDKLAMGHGERRVLNDTATRAAIRVPFEDAHKTDDPDWIGETLRDLENCECEADFFEWAHRADFEDVCERFVYEWGGYLRGLCDRLLPELKRVLKAL